MKQLTPRRPYLFNAFYDWIIDNELTPYIVVDTMVSGVTVPSEFIQNNQIVLNIAPASVGNYLANHEKIEFNARFGGVLQHIIVPMASIEAIYARENNIGIGFEDEPAYQYHEEIQSNVTKDVKSPFKIVK